LGLKGLVDLVLEIDGEKTPVEIKTVENSQILESLKGPKLSHMSQANFYSHVLGSKGAYIMYAARDDPSKRKIFYEPYSPGMLVGDVTRFRGALRESMQENPNMALNWSKQLNAMGFDIPSGIRPELNQGYQGKDVMKSLPLMGFPGGRAQLFNRPERAILPTTGRSKIRDQGARNHFKGVGHPKTPVDRHISVNPSRYGDHIG